MSLTIHRADEFNTDFDRQYRWYLEEAGEDVAGRFLQAVARTLPRLAKQPDLGRRRKFRQPPLQGLRSFQVDRPFHKLLIFYRSTDDTLQAWRLMHGARNLSRRLVEPLI